jgi:putative membrane protein
LIDFIRNLVGGFLMGSADIVPGVSGGTIALILGIYERLVASIREGSSALGTLLKRDISGFRSHLSQVEWAFLLPLLGGILLAVVTLASFIEHQLEERPTIMAGAFFGLVIGSVVVAWALIKLPKPVHVVVVLGVGVALFFALGLGDDSVVSGPTGLQFFGAGALAICAMILPGISGSLMLLLVGMYTPLIGAVNERDLPTVGIFLAGAIVGLALFSQVLHWALSKHHDVVMAALVGLMAGSLRIVWPWPEGVDSSALSRPGDDGLQVLLAAVVGFVAVFVITRLAGSSTVSEQLPTA